MIHNCTKYITTGSYNLKYLTHFKSVTIIWNCVKEMCLSELCKESQSNVMKFLPLNLT